MKDLHSSASIPTTLKRRVLGLAGCVALSMSAVACGGDDAGDVPQNDPIDWEACPRVRSGTMLGHSVQVCEALHEEAPFVRPPADTDTTAYVATDGDRIYARGQEPRALDAGERSVMGLDADDLGGPERKISGFTIYRVGLDAAGKVTSSAPIVLIDELLFLTFLVGKSADGLISRHVSDDEASFQYEQEPTLPIRIRFTGLVADTGEALGGGAIERSGLSVIVENLTSSVSDAAGACLPAMTAAGDESPFAGEDRVELVGTRVPAMHGRGDNTFVIDGLANVNHMSQAWMVMPHHLLGSGPVSFERAQFTPHGSPTSMPLLALELVDGATAECSAAAAKSPRP